MGLAQLYQLARARRACGQRAYAYFPLQPPAVASENPTAARRHLRVARPGSGFKLALKDLEIRGAGNLLGVEQHGAIAAVGLELYNSMLRDAVESQKTGTPVEMPVGLTLDLPIEHFLPREYVPDEKLRLQVYHDLAAVVDEQGLEAAERNLADRFGKPPAPVRNLLYAVAGQAARPGGRIAAVETDGDWLVMRLPAAGMVTSAGWSHSSDRSCMSIRESADLDDPGRRPVEGARARRAGRDRAPRPHCGCGLAAIT